jgi:hypothetical protein
MFDLITNLTKQQAEFLTAVATAASVVVALITSVVSIVVASRALKDQRRHNLLAIKPYANILLENYVNFVGIFIANNGVGPLIIKELRVWQGDDKETFKHDALSWTEEGSELKGITWRDYHTNIAKGTCIRPGEQFVIISIAPGEKTPAGKLEHARRVLSALHFWLEYGDIAEREQRPIEQHFGWLATQEKLRS